MLVHMLVHLHLKRPEKSEKVEKIGTANFICAKVGCGHLGWIFCCLAMGGADGCAVVAFHPRANENTRVKNVSRCVGSGLYGEHLSVFGPKGDVVFEELRFQFQSDVTHEFRDGGPPEALQIKN